MRSRPPTLGPLGRTPTRTARSIPSPALGSPVATPPPEDGEGGLVRKWLRGAFVENTGLKFLSMVLAITVFLLINTDKDREITVRVGVNYDFPADKVLTSKPIEDVRVTIKGPWRRLRQFDERELSRVVLPLRDAPTGDVPITPDMISGLPPGLSVTSISPKVAHVSFDKSREKVVEIEPVVSGLPRHGYVKTEVRASPTTIKVRGGENLLAALSSIPTSQVNIDDKFETYEDLVMPSPPEGVTVVDKAQRITVQVRINQALVTRTVPNVPVEPRGDSSIEAMKWSIVPSHVDVELTGPQLLVEKTQAKMVPVVRIDRAPGDTRPHEFEVKLEGIAPNSGLGVRLSPERVVVSPVAIKPPPAP